MSQERDGLGILGGATRIVAIITATAIGTLMRKTDPHQKNSRRNPPRIRPVPEPTTATDPRIAIARFLSRSSVNVTRTSARVAGIMAAAPNPNRARATTKNQAVGENAAISDAKVKAAVPTTNISRCPIRSPRVPVPSNRPDKISGYALMNHNPCRGVASNCFRSSGRAVYKIELSAPIRYRLALRIAKKT